MSRRRPVPHDRPAVPPAADDHLADAASALRILITIYEDQDRLLRRYNWRLRRKLALLGRVIWLLSRHSVEANSHLEEQLALGRRQHTAASGHLSSAADHGAQIQDLLDTFAQAETAASNVKPAGLWTLFASCLCETLQQIEGKWTVVLRANTDADEQLILALTYYRRLANGCDRLRAG